MMDPVYKDILIRWEESEAIPALYEHLDAFFPEFGFVRMQAGGPKDHWASRKKIDLSIPKHRVAEKTVVYRTDMRFREQGDWDNGVSVLDKIIEDYSLPDLFQTWRFIAEKLCLQFPEENSSEVVESRKRVSRKDALLGALVDFFSAQLQKGTSSKCSATRKYLLSVRGFSKEDLVKFQLGSVPSWDEVVRHIVMVRKFRLEELDEVCGVRNEEGYTAVGKTYTLAIPYICGGKAKGFLFRRLDDSRPGPKYIATAGLERKRVFFNMPEKLSTGTLVVVEGEMDALKATSAGIQNVVAIGGSEIAGERRLQLEDAFRRGVERIILCLDLDSEKDSEVPNLEARHGHIMKSIHTIKDVAPAFEDIFIASFQEPSDPDQFIRERGGEDFNELLKEAKPYWRYLFDYKEGKLTL